MGAALRGTDRGIRSVTDTRARWTALRDVGRFRGAILAQERALRFLSDAGDHPTLVFGDTFLGDVATNARALAEFLQSPELAPEGEFFALAEDESFSVHADRAMGRVLVTVWVE